MNYQIQLQVRLFVKVLTVSFWLSDVTFHYRTKSSLVQVTVCRHFGAKQWRFIVNIIARTNFCDIWMIHKCFCSGTCMWKCKSQSIGSGLSMLTFLQSDVFVCMCISCQSSTLTPSVTTRLPVIAAGVVESKMMGHPHAIRPYINSGIVAISHCHHWKWSLIALQSWRLWPFFS